MVRQPLDKVSDLTQVNCRLETVPVVEVKATHLTVLRYGLEIEMCDGVPKAMDQASQRASVFSVSKIAD